MPDRIEPCLALLKAGPPKGPEWAFEIKWDGYRIAIHIEPKGVRIITRGGHDWTDRFPAIAKAAKKRRNIVTCHEAMNARDGRWLMTAGLVLVRQKPGSAKGVMFLTIEDESGPANVVVWPNPVFQRVQTMPSFRSWTTGNLGP